MHARGSLILVLLWSSLDCHKEPPTSYILFLLLHFSNIHQNIFSLCYLWIFVFSKAIRPWIIVLIIEEILLHLISPSFLLFEVQCGIFFYNIWFPHCVQSPAWCNDSSMAAHVKILFLGHSFMRRMHEHFVDIYFEWLHEHFQNIHFEFFGLKPDEFSLYWKGLGGLKAKDLFQFNDMTRDIQPPILFLEVGTKDLCDPIMLHDDIALLVKIFWVFPLIHGCI